MGLGIYCPDGVGGFLIAEIMMLNDFFYDSRQQYHRDDISMYLNK